MTCIAVDVPITIYESGTFDQTFQWKTGDPAVEVDLTGFSAKMIVRAKITDTAALITIEESLGPWVADGDSAVYLDEADEGKYRVYVNDTDTTGICALHKNLISSYDLFLTSPAGESVFKQYGVANLVAANVR
jgi:hypothetical protein